MKRPFLEVSFHWLIAISHVCFPAVWIHCSNKKKTFHCVLCNKIHQNLQGFKTNTCSDILKVKKSYWGCCCHLCWLLVRSQNGCLQCTLIKAAFVIQNLMTSLHGCVNYWLNYFHFQHVRIRRLLRPFFLIQNSSLMKKLVSEGLNLFSQLLHGCSPVQRWTVYLFITVIFHFY